MLFRSWIEAISRLKHDPALRQKLSESAFADLLKNFTWEKRVEIVLDFASGRRTSVIGNKAA